MILAKDKTVEELIAVMIEHGLEARLEARMYKSSTRRFARMGLPPAPERRAAILRAMGLPKDKWAGKTVRSYDPTIFPDGFVEAALLLTELKTIN